MPEDMDKRWTVSLLILLFAVSVAVRSLPFGHVFDNGGVFFFEGDCYLHIRKILLHIKYFPHFVTFDFFEGYPEGTPAVWPPLLDWLISLVSILIGMGNPSVRVVEATAALLPPFAGGLTVIAVYYFAKEVFNKKVALISSALLAFMPAHIEFTILGRPDNEMMEPLMVALLFLGYIRMQGGRKSEHYIVFFSLAALFSLLFWRGATVWVMLAAFVGFIDTTVDFVKKDAASKKYLRIGGAFLLLSGYLFPICYFDVWGTRNAFSFNLISWFHITAFGIVSAAMYAYGYCCSLWLKRKFPWAVFLVLAAGAAGVLLKVLFLVLPVFRENLTAGLGVIGIGGQDTWLESIAEYQPLLKNGFWRVLHDYYGWVFWLIPAILVYLGIGLFRDGFRDRGKVVFVVMSACILALSLLRRRFMHILAIDAAIMGGWLVFYSCLLASRGGRKLNTVVLSSVLSVLLFYPFASAAYRMPSMTIGYSVKGDIQDSMVWLRENTPAPQDPVNPLLKPPYSVMAPWDFAGWIEYIAQRPVVATLYGTEAYGYKEAMNFYTTSEESQANAVMKRTGARYVVISEPKTDREWHDQGSSLSLVSTRLHIADGMDMDVGIIAVESVDRYRLVYESGENVESLPWFPGDVKRIKVFEHVKGAELIVNISPGEKVLVYSRVMTNQGRVFDFIKEKWAGTEGSASFILPYAPLGEPGQTGLVLPYEARAGGRTFTVSITEADVHEGSMIKVQIPK